MRAHRHDDRARRHDKLRKRTFSFRSESFHCIVAEHASQRRAFDFYADEFLYRWEPDRTVMGRTLAPKMPLSTNSLASSA